MLIQSRKTFAVGVAMAGSFSLVFLFMFTPSFRGRNAFQAADTFFNSVAKGSTDFFPRLREEIDAFERIATFPEARLEVSLELPRSSQEAAERLFSDGIADGRPAGNRLEMKGSLPKILRAVLMDAEAMFHNREAEVAVRRGRSGKETLFAWWQISRGMELELKRAKKIRAAELVEAVRTKGLEVAYNFNGIEPIRIRDRAPLVSFLLVSYIVYTVWWGFALLFIATGLGLRLKAGRKKET